MFYAKSTGGFYIREINGDAIPADAVEITQEQYVALNSGPMAGRITAEADGYPVQIVHVPPSLDSLKEAAKEQVRSLRTNVFYTLAGMQSEALANGDTTTAKAIAGIQVKLRELPDIDLSACKTAEDVTAAFTSAWLAIVAAAPLSVVSAFAQVVA